VAHLPLARRQMSNSGHVKGVEQDVLLSISEVVMTVDAVSLRHDVVRYGLMQTTWNLRLRHDLYAVWTASGSCRIIHYTVDHEQWRTSALRGCSPGIMLPLPGRWCHRTPSRVMHIYYSYRSVQQMTNITARIRGWIRAGAVHGTVLRPSLSALTTARRGIKRWSQL
jgi:hypothetical protein